MKILVVKLSSLGDVLHALPTAEALVRERGAVVHWAVQPEFAELVRSFGCVKRVIEVPRPSNLRGYLAAICATRKTSYDFVVDLQGLLKSAVFARYACRAPALGGYTAVGSVGGKCVIGPSFARECAGLFYDATPPKRKVRVHAVEECLDVLEMIPANKGAPARPIKSFGIMPGESPIPRSGAKRVAIAPCSRWESKNWPSEYFAEVALALAKRGTEVFTIGGKGDWETGEALARTVSTNLSAGESHTPHCVNLCGKLSLLESAALLKTCDCLITNDSGPMHIAAALGVRCVVPFGPTDPSRTGPYDNCKLRHAVLRADGVCDLAPCGKRVCPKGTNACLRAILPATVFLSAAELLGLR